MHELYALVAVIGAQLSTACCCTLQGQMQPSAKLQQLLEAGLQQHGPALAARPRPGLLDEEMLAAVEAAGGPQVFEMMGQSGFLANAQLFQTLQVSPMPSNGSAQHVQSVKLCVTVVLHPIMTTPDRADTWS